MLVLEETGELRSEIMLLVTGITGHSGRYFLQELMKNKYEGCIRCIIRENSDTTMLDNSGLNIEKLVGNLDDIVFLNKAMVGVDTILHIYNIRYSPVILHFAMKHNVKRLILVHTTGIYSKYKMASHEYKKIEQYVQRVIEHSKRQISLTILRPTMIYGDICDKNISRFIRMIDKFRIMPVINAGKNLIQPVNARDLGKAYYDVLMQPEKTVGKAYDLSGDKPISLIDVQKLITRELSRKTLFIPIPMKVAVIITTIFRFFSFHKFDYVEQIQRMGEDRSYSHDMANRDFGFQPMCIEEGIHIEVQEYLKDRLNI